ncbi:hypothetical protein [Cellulomonas cellasea]|uniref:Uncharacterized protein n=1 Tax=Cellulomonas cellasea TaxID=43670 RepID=A0A7W4UBY4_9CELL|nr:hypothetical protein [Cellulomonas cellasea]MBB2921284.1 hypothetical protein [Cellulomonas cellasea]
MSLPLKDLHALSLEELERRHDEAAENTFVGISYYLDEVRRREQLAVMRSSERLARASFRLSLLSAILAGVAAVAAVIALLQ